MTTQYTTTADQAQFDAIEAKIQELRDLVASTVQGNYDYTDTELEALELRQDTANAAITAIENQLQVLDPEGVVAAIASIQAFIDAVDADGNLVIDGLPSVLADVADLKPRVQNLETNQAAILGRLDTKDATDAAHAARLETLENAVDEVTSEAQVIGIAEAKATDQGRQVLNQLGATFAGAAIEPIVFVKRFPITGFGGEVSENPPGAGDF